MAGTRRLTDLHKTAQAKLRLPDGALVVALSGGADSAGLGAIVTSMGRPVRALHIDHGLTHSPMMRDAAADVAAGLGMDLEVIEVEVPDGPSPEGQARSARYRGLSVATRSGESVLTAHTAEDNVETVLMNLLRGTGIHGLAGIPPYRATGIFRPALGVSRSLLREIAYLSGLGFVDDPMNLDPALTRNYVRAEVMPKFGVLNPDIVGAITRMSESIRADADHLDDAAGNAPLDLGPGVARCPIGTLLAVPVPVSSRIMMQMLRHVAGGSAVSSDRVGVMRAILHGEAEGGEVGGGAVCTRQGPFLEVRAGDEGLDEGLTGSQALTPGLHRVGRLSLEVLARDEVCRVAPLSRWHAIFPLKSVLEVSPDGVVLAEGDVAWVPGEKRLPHAWYLPGTVGYLSVFAREESG